MTRGNFLIELVVCVDGSSVCWHSGSCKMLLLYVIVHTHTCIVQLNKTKHSGVTSACSHCLKDCVEYLLGLEATHVNEADVFGMLPLHHAISMCKTQVRSNHISSTAF